MIDIRSATVLPADREPVTLTTSDGLRLVGELASPEGSSPAATLVCLHPLPTAGGMMDSHVQRKASWRLPALAGVAVLRFNTRGTASRAGTSDGTFDAGQREGLDLLAALDLVAARAMPNVWLFGWSFGSDVTLQHGLDPRVVGAVLLSPPLRSTSDAVLDRWAADGRPLVRPGSGARRLPASGRGASSSSPGSLRQRSSASRAHVTSGSASRTSAGRSTSSSGSSSGRRPYPFPPPGTVRTRRTRTSRPSPDRFTRRSVVRPQDQTDKTDATTPTRRVKRARRARRAPRRRPWDG